jgi:hypothetical protein
VETIRKVVAESTYYPDVFMEVLKETAKKVGWSGLDNDLVEIKLRQEVIVDSGV